MILELLKSTGHRYTSRIKELGAVYHITLSECLGTSIKTLLKLRNYVQTQPLRSDAHANLSMTRFLPGLEVVGGKTLSLVYSGQY
jgi:hypothetical protein